MNMEPSIGLASIGDTDSRQMVEIAKKAEAHGLSSIWFADEPFFRGAMPMASACALATSHIRVGVGIVSPYDHPPAWMAKDFATIDELSEGRAILGVGASWGPPIEAQGIPWTRPLSAVGDTVEIVRDLLAGNVCTYRGTKFEVSGVQLGFPSYRTDPPILVGSMFPKSLRQTGKIADGVILSVLCPTPYVRRALALMAEGAKEAETARPPVVIQYFPMQVSLDGTSARDSVRAQLVELIKQSYAPEPEHWAKVAEMGEFDLDEFESIYSNSQRGYSAREIVGDDFLDRFAIAGTPAQCMELLKAYKAAGVTEAVAVLPSWADMAEQARLIGHHLVPGWHQS